MNPSFINIIIPFNQNAYDSVMACLVELGPETHRNGSVRTALRFQGVHFMSIIPVAGDAQYSAYLVIEAVVDGNEADAVHLIADKLDVQLRAIFGAADLGDQSHNIHVFLSKHLVRTSQSLLGVPGLNHVGIPGMTVDRIQCEFQFADKVRQAYFAQTPCDSSLETLQRIRESISAEVASDQSLVGMMEPADMTILGTAPTDPGTLGTLAKLLPLGLLKFAWPLLLLFALVIFVTLLRSLASGVWLTFANTFLVIAALFLVLLVIAFFVFRSLREKERTDLPDDSPPELNRLAEVISLEDDGDNNHLAGVSYMKPGWLRMFAVRVAFWVIAQFSRLKFKPGFLAELGTIHFARWVLIPKTNRLIFLSNYSGSWESYLEDFITKASDGLTGVWSNTYGFPTTELLFLKGATDGDRFKRWARRQQQPSHFWYSAYPNTTTELIRLNAAIRHGLTTAITETQATDWLSLFGSRRRQPTSVQTDRVQSLMFRGMGRLRWSQCTMLRLPESTEGAKHWLGSVLPQLNFGDVAPNEQAICLALSPSGLKKLGLSEDVLTNFPINFLQGMADPVRAKMVLKDTEDDDPSNWVWGSASTPVDVALLTYAIDKPNVISLTASLVNPLTSSGGQLVHQIDTNLSDNKPEREHFGFVDGVSQPILRGTRRWQKNQDSQHVAEPGEFILGYPDNHGQLPSTPAMPSNQDPNNLLPLYRLTSDDHEWPRTDLSPENQAHDFGKHGSFLVIRQLEQHVKLFEETLEEKTKELYENGFRLPAMPADESIAKSRMSTWLGSKLVGRWPDGTSLTRYPNRPGNGWEDENYSGERIPPDNDFFHGSEDPEGFHCPFSAHIRRTNPRDSFVPGSEEELSIVNRHRILRVGRKYVADTPNTNDKEKGLLFMCLNADIQRQFEFIQQTWVMARLFHGLRNEVDLILGRGHSGGKITIPSQTGALQVTGFKDFVRVRGGDYFFLPGKDALRFLANK